MGIKMAPTYSALTQAYLEESLFEKKKQIKKENLLSQGKDI